MKCKQCGTPNPRDAEYCYNCGNKLSQGGTGKIAAIIIAAVVVVVAVAALVIFLGGSSDSPDPSVEPEASAESQAPEEETAPEHSPESASPYFPHVYASSMLAPQYGNSYEPEQIMDGDMATAWVEGASHMGLGEWIEWTAEEAQTVSGIEIVNGYCKSDEAYTDNCRVREARVTFEDGSSEIIMLRDEFARYQTFDFSVSRKTSVVTLEILTVYEGVKYEDACISEVNFY